MMQPDIDAHDGDENSSIPVPLSTLKLQSEQQDSAQERCCTCGLQALLFQQILFADAAYGVKVRNTFIHFSILPKVTSRSRTCPDAQYVCSTCTSLDDLPDLAPLTLAHHARTAARWKKKEHVPKYLSSLRQLS